MKFNNLVLNPILREEGIWIEHGEDEYKIELKVRSMRSAKAIEYIANNRDVLSDLSTNDDFTDLVTIQKIAKLAAFALVTDWKGIDDDSDNPMPFDVNSCYDVLIAAPELALLVFAKSSDIATFRTAKEDDVKKKSVTSSSGKPTTVKAKKR